MKRTHVNPKTLPAPVGFNHGVILKGKRILFLAGQNGANQKAEIVSADFAVQFETALANLLQVLEEAGGGPENIGMMNFYVTRRADYAKNRAKLGKIWRKHLGTEYPAAALFEVKGLWDPKAKVEIEAIAVL